MIPQGDNIFIIPINDKSLVYSPLNGISALINFSGAIELKQQLSLRVKKQENPSSRLFDLAGDILQSPFHTPLKKAGELTPEFMGVIPTRDCNGACIYCDFRLNNAPSVKMSYQMASKATDWYIDLLEKQKRKNIEIHFFGGEPMMAEDVIEIVVHRARIMAAEKKMMTYFEISTNGLYAEKKAFFLGNYFQKVILSLDGTREAHNFQRPMRGEDNSFENSVRTAHILSKSQAELCLRACISTKNIKEMEQITGWFCETFNPSAINFEILSPTVNTGLLDLFPPDPYDFASGFIRSKEIGKQYGIQVVYASDIGAYPVTSSCPVGKDAAIFSPDGRISNCYLLPDRWQDIGLDLDFGNINDKGVVEIKNHKVDSIREMVLNKPRCSKCFCKWHCAGGCHVGNTFPGSSTTYDNFCIQTRIISANTLLSALDMSDETDQLINNPKNMKKLALNRSDLLSDFNDPEHD